MYSSTAAHKGTHSHKIVGFTCGTSVGQLSTFGYVITIASPRIIAVCQYSNYVHSFECIYTHAITFEWLW